MHDIVVPPSDPSSEADAIVQGRIPPRWLSEIKRLARKFASASSIGSASLADELNVAGLLALWRAAGSFDPARKTPFEHLARRTIRNAMLTELRALDRPLGLAQARSLRAPSIAPKLVEPEDTGPEVTHERAEVRATVREWISTCEPPLQEIFTLLYEEGLSQREAAIRMGVSQPRISQYHTRLVTNGRQELVALAA